VAKLLEGAERRSFRSRDEQEVAGYAEAMRLIHDSHVEITLTENNIKCLHKVILQFSAKDSWHLGEYKKHPTMSPLLMQKEIKSGLFLKPLLPWTHRA
jgi:hypothetical protein